MGRKNKRKVNKTSSNKGDNDKSTKQVSMGCETPEVSFDNEQPKKLITSGSTEKTEMSNDNASSKEPEILFDRYRPNTERFSGREYFIHSLCQVCKEELNNSVSCPECQMISYCSQQHRRQHWAEHADLCRAIVKVCADRHAGHIMQGSLNCSADDFRVLRFRNMVECEAKVERPLDRWEREMFIFPNVCGTCYEFNTKCLVICECCRHSGFCKEHQTSSHNKWCKLLLLYKNIIKDQNKFGIVSPSIPISKLSSVLPLLQDMKNVFKGVLNYIDFFEFVELTEIVTYPITALDALLTRKKIEESKNVTLHIIGAEADFELNKLEKWEYYILHLIPELKNLEIIFIGPELELTKNHKDVSVCPKCRGAKKSITFTFQKDFYHTFSKKSMVSKPQLICVFNPGLYRTTGYNNEDTWSPSIASMFAMDCPVLVTAYTHKEILLDLQRVKQTQQIHLEREPMLNPFSSMKPNLNFVSDEESPVIFKNQYYCIMRTGTAQ